MVLADFLDHLEDLVRENPEALEMKVVLEDYGQYLPIKDVPILGSHYDTEFVSKEAMEGEMFEEGMINAILIN